MSEIEFPAITSLISELMKLIQLLEKQKIELKKKDRDIKHLQADNADLTRMIQEMRTPDDQEDEGPVETYTLIDSTPAVALGSRPRVKSLYYFDAAKVFSEKLVDNLDPGIAQVTYRFSGQDDTVYQFAATRTPGGGVKTVFHFHGMEK